MKKSVPIGLDTVLDKKCAVLVVDVQNDFCHPEGNIGKSGRDMRMLDCIILPIQNLVNAAHAHGFPVIYMKQEGCLAIASDVWRRTGRGNGFDDKFSICENGTWGNELYKLTPRKDDVVLSKPRFDSFMGTPLESILRTHKIETLVIVGVATNICVETAVRHACCADYFVVVARDGCATWNQEEHKMSLSTIDKYFGDVTDSDTVIKAWNK